MANIVHVATFKCFFTKSTHVLRTTQLKITHRGLCMSLTLQVFFVPFAAGAAKPYFVSLSGLSKIKVIWSLYC